MPCPCNQIPGEFRIDPTDAKPHNYQCFHAYHPDGAQKWAAAAPLPEDAESEFVNETDISTDYPRGESRINNGANKKAITQVHLFPTTQCTVVCAG